MTVAAQDSGSRLLMVTAIISALAGIFGAAVGGAVGGYCAFKAAESQAMVQESNAQIDRRREEYKDFVSSELDMRPVDYQIANIFSHAPPDGRYDGLDKLLVEFNDLRAKEARQDYFVQLVASAPVSAKASSIAQCRNEIYTLVYYLDDQVYKHQSLNQGAVNKLNADVDGFERLISDFNDTASEDMKPPQPGSPLFSPGG